MDTGFGGVYIMFKWKIWRLVNHGFICRGTFLYPYYYRHIYTKKKTEKERDILFLLAAKLGVKTINYKITKVIHTYPTQAIKTE